MTLICAWCDRLMRVGVPPISHGLCASCLARILDAVPPIAVPA